MTEHWTRSIRAVWLSWPAQNGALLLFYLAILLGLLLMYGSGDFSAERISALDIAQWSRAIDDEVRAAAEENAPIVFSADRSVLLELVDSAASPISDAGD